MFPRQPRPVQQPFHHMPHFYIPQRHGFRPSYLPYEAHAHNDNYDFWCETCDRGFKTAGLLDTHTKEHEKCNIDGCQFVAHPKVITKHIQMQHSTGLFKRIAKLNDPDEIKKWREERKSKYPTKLNIDKKAAVVIEKIERGEKMALNNRHNNRRDFQNKSRTGYGAKRQFPHTQMNATNGTGEPRTKIQRNKQKRQPKEAPVKEEKYRLKEFSGIQTLIEDSDSDEEPQMHNDLEIDDEDDIIHETKQIDNTVVCGALTTIIGNYGSSDEGDGDTENVIHGINSSSGKGPELQDKISQDTLIDTVCDDDSGPEEVSNVKLNIESNGNHAMEGKNIPPLPSKVAPSHKPQKPRQIPRRPKPKPPSTLLRKLLHREVQQERNIILQCVRHIVKNNYFDK